MPLWVRQADHSGIPLAIARLVLGLFFIYTGWVKAQDPSHFLKMLRLYEAIPNSQYILQNVIAVTLPWLEIACGACLLLGVFLRGTGLLLVGMLTVFTIMIAHRAWGIHAGQGLPFCAIKFNCGCGTGDEFVCRKLPENFALWLAAWIPLLSRSRRFCLESVFRSQPAALASADSPPATP